VPDRALALPTRANGGISPDGRRITYRIRTGRWSDGAPFDARDVGFTIDALRNPRTAVPDTSAVADVVSWSAPRPDTLVVRLREPSAPFITSFLTLGANDPFAILPRHIAARYVSLDQSSLDTNPVGLGPFRLLRWSAASGCRSCAIRTTGAGPQRARASMSRSCRMRRLVCCKCERANSI